MARTGRRRQRPGGRRTASKGTSKRTSKPARLGSSASGSGFSPKIVFGVLGGILAVALIVMVAIGTASEQGPTAQLPSGFVVEIDGDSLVQLETTGSDLAVGRPIPEVTSVDLAGNHAAISHDGLPKIILFLAHWCPYCRAEVPALQAYLDEHPLPEGIDFVSVVTATDPNRPNYPPNAWLESEGWTQRVVFDDPNSDIAAAYGLPAFPYYVFVDGEGNVVTRIAGGQAPELIGSAAEALVAGA